MPLDFEALSEINRLFATILREGFVTDFSNSLSLMLARFSHGLSSGVEYSEARVGSIISEIENDQFPKAFLAIARTLGDLNLLALKILDTLSYGVVVIDEAESIIYKNEYAEGLLRKGDVLCANDNKLRLASQRDDKRLYDAIANVRTAGVDDRAAAATFRVARGPKKFPLYLHIVPVVVNQEKEPLTQSYLIVLIADPGKEIMLSPDLMKRVFGLTAAETALANRLVNGSSVREAAMDLKIAYNTARSQMTSILRKTDVKRQDELVRVLLAIFSIV